MRCQRDCPGTIVDGYCDTCGMAPVADSARPVAVPAASPAAAAPSAPAPSIRTGAASHGSSSARGSARTGGQGRGGSQRRRFGGGLVDVAAVPQVDPATVVMTDPQVPEDRRFCARCGKPVGRSRGDRPGRSFGFCPSCGEPFDVTAKLAKGDLIGGQYEVAGALAHGGLGWIYLALDRNVSNRWVVLKGLLNAGDRDALAAAVAERRFLAEVEHPNIVKIYNFVEHDGAGYIVMEYVGGESLKAMLKRRRAAAGNTPDPMPVDQALAYLLEVMPAFAYLHDRGLIFCDFKPDNVIQTGDQVKLIDLGGVVHVDDPDATIYGTVGYQAPEMSTAGPSVASDLFTIGRTLAVLTTDFRGYQSTYQYSLPDRDQFAAYRDFESFYRLVLRATSTDPADRFVDAAEMSEQMLGVLRQVLSADGEPRPAVSRLFTGEQRTDPQADTPLWRDLPGPLIDLGDPAAAFLASVTVTDPAEVLALLATAPQDTPEVRLRALRAHIDLGAASGSFDDARRARDELAATDGADWRLVWYDGLLALAAGEYPAAHARFDSVYSALPGELAPQLALALSLELAGQPAAAAGYYDVVSRTDRAFTTAAAGLARCRLAAGDRTGAVAAYNRVPGTSAAYRGSQIGAIRALVRQHGSVTAPGTQPAPASGTPSTPAPDTGSAAAEVANLTAAAALIDRLELDAGQLASLRAELFEQVLSVLAGGVAVPAAVLGVRDGGPADERSVRFALESAYRQMASSATGPEKIRLVDLANTSRPRTRT